MTETSQLKDSMSQESGRKLVNTATKAEKAASHRQDVDDLDNFMRSSTEVDVLSRAKDDWKGTFLPFALMPHAEILQALQNGLASFGDRRIGH
jgi:hypothetical protein